MREYDYTVIGLCGRSVFLSVDHFHAPEETLHAYALSNEPGGKAYNQAVAGIRLGARVCFAGAVGCDSDADECEKYLVDEGVSAAVFFRKTSASTAFACILSNASGENRVTVYPGASDLITAEDVKSLSSYISQSEYLLITTELPEEAFCEAIQLAKVFRTRIIINPAPYKPWMEKYLQFADCITPNREEYKSLSGYLKRNPPQDNFEIVITLGNEGAKLQKNGNEHSFSAPKIDAKDSTGAGDAFNAALTLMLSRGVATEEAVRFAVEVASESVRYPNVLGSYRFEKFRNKI